MSCPRSRSWIIERIEARNQSLNALVYLGFDDARERSREAEQALVSGGGARRSAWGAHRDQGPVRLQPGLAGDLRRRPGLQEYILDISCAFAERIQRAGAIVVGKTNSPVMGLRGTCDNYLFGPSRNPLAPAKNTGARRGAARPRSPTGWCRWRRGPMGVGPSASRPPGAAWTATRLPLVASLPQPAQRLLWHQPVPVRGTDHQDGRGCRARPGRPGRLRLQDPFSIDTGERFMPAVRRSISGWQIAYSPDFDVFPVDQRVTEVVSAAVPALEQAGAQVEEVRLGIDRDQGE